MFFQKLNEAVAENKSLLIESTLSGRYLLKLFETWRKQNYQITIVFLFVESPEILIERIAERVKKGGHFVSNEDVRRRFARGKQNFWHIYEKLTDRWFLYYNMEDNFQLVAIGENYKLILIDEVLFEKFSQI